jgi:hypothetical protein
MLLQCEKRRNVCGVVATDLEHLAFGDPLNVSCRDLAIPCAEIKQRIKPLRHFRFL